MKILCIANEIDPNLYTKNIKAEFSHIDFIVSSGDLPIEYLNFISSSLEKPLYYVLSKHEVLSAEKPNSYLKLLSEPIVVNGLVIAGVSGAKYEGENLISFDKKIRAKRVKALTFKLFWNYKATKKRPIIVSYTNEPNFPEVQNLIALRKPSYFIYGQVHLYNGENRISTQNSTTLVNASGHYVLEV